MNTNQTAINFQNVTSEEYTDFTFIGEIENIDFAASKVKKGYDIIFNSTSYHSKAKKIGFSKNLNLVVKTEDELINILEKIQNKLSGIENIVNLDNVKVPEYK